MRGALQTIMSMLSLTQTMGIEGNKYVAYGSSKMLYSYGCIYRSIFYLVIDIILLDTYSRIPNKYCNRNGNRQDFSEIGIAKERCSKDDSCVGFNDISGAGNRYQLCTQPLDITPDSTSGFILHIRDMGKLTNAFAISHDCKKFSNIRFK